MNVTNSLAVQNPAGSAISDGQLDRSAALAFVTDDASEAALRGGLTEFLGSLHIHKGGIRTASKMLENADSPRVLIVDVAGLEDPFGALDALGAVCAPDTKVVVIGDRTEISFYREVTRHLGVDDYLAKPLTRDGVSTLIGPYIAGAAHQRAASRGGRVVAVCGARGGVGATTVAVNLALQISEETHGNVALLDLHLRGGHATMMFGVKSGPALRQALENPDLVDALLLERVAIPFGDRLRIIAADEPFEADPTPTAAGVARVLELLRQRFNVIVVDLPTPHSPAERMALQLARHAIVVLGPDVASLRDAEKTRRMITTLVGAGRTMMVLNRANQPGALKLGLIEEGLGGKPDITIPDLPKLLPQAANMGRPALHDSTILQRALSPLTQEISGVEQQRKGGGLLWRLLGR